MQDYATKPDIYFSSAREEIAPLLPPHAQRVLEVGCGSGQTLRWLKDTGRCAEAVGIELFENAATIARQHADRVVVGNAEQLVEGEFERASFDLVLCLDVLEHLVDPWIFVAKVERLLKPGGLLIASIPNVRHLKVLLPLIFLGRWRYEPDGLLDRTHLRFFTRASAMALLTTDRLRVTGSIRKVPALCSKSGLLNLLTFGLIKDLLAMQYLIVARRSADACQE